MSWAGPHGPEWLDILIVGTPAGVFDLEDEDEPLHVVPGKAVQVAPVAAFTRTVKVRANGRCDSNHVCMGCFLGVFFCT